MKMDMSELKDEPRLLIEVPLKPVQGTRFQPTGFPDLGAATYQLNDGTQMLLVESAQSMANRMEAVCWDEAKQKPLSILDDMPYVESTLPDKTKTNSLLEAHRLNSPYIVRSKEFKAIKKEIGFEKDKPFDRLKLAKTLFRFDPNSLIHGIFLEKVGGVVRLPRMLSGFIEATNVNVAPSGGAKFDRIQPETTGENTPYGTAKDGYGNIIYHRDEFTGPITAYFNFDLALLRGYGLGQKAEEFLVALSLLKIQKFLNQGLRLRTTCDLEVAGKIKVVRPDGYSLPELGSLESEIPKLIKDISDFVKPPLTPVIYDKKAK